MIKLIKEDIVKSNDLFELVTISGTTMDDVPWFGYEVRSKGLAEKCVVEIKLDHAWKDYEQRPTIDFNYTRSYVDWGLSSQPVNVNDMIYALEEAEKFRVNVVNPYLGIKR